MQSMEPFPAVGRSSSYQSVAALSYTEQWSSLQSAYHPIPPNYLPASPRGEPPHFGPVSADGASSETSGAGMELSGSQLSNEPDASVGGVGQQAPRSTKTPTISNVSPTKDLVGLRTFQPLLPQDRLSMQTQPTMERDRYGFDPRWVEPKFHQDREWLTVAADSDAADALLSMKRSAVVHLNTAMIKTDSARTLCGQDNRRASMLKGLYYENSSYDDKQGSEQTVDKESLLRRGNEMLVSEGRDKTGRDSLDQWYWRQQEVKRILNSDESYESPTAKESSPGPDDFQPMDYYVMDEHQTTGYANNYTTFSPYYKIGVQTNNNDYMSNTRYYSRSNGDSVTSDFSSARWNINSTVPAIPRSNQQPFITSSSMGTPDNSRAVNVEGSVAEMDRGGPLAQVHQKKKCKDDEEGIRRASSNHQCHICGKSCTRPSSLKTHLRSHYGEKPYLCQLCGKHFSQTANLTAHMRIHSGEKPFKCTECNRTFSQSSSVKTHMRTHTGERPYTCMFCSKAFSDSSTLSNHRRTHTGEKPYTCRVCCRPFSQSGNLNRHMRIHKRK